MPKPSPFADRWFLSLPLGATRTTVRIGTDVLPTIDAGPERGGWTAPIPGWAWRDIKPGRDLKLKLGDGLIRKTVVLSRPQLVERLIRLTERPPDEVPIFDLISAIEHAHYAKGTFGSLPEHVQVYLHRAAAESGLSGVLPGRSAAPPIAGESPGEDPLTRRVVAEFGAARRANAAPTDIDLLRKVLREVTPSTTQRRTIALELTPHFCTRDGPAALYDLLLDGDLSLIAPQEDMAWQGSHCLPGRLLAQDADGAASILADLAAHPDRWAATPAIGWSLRYLADPASDLFQSSTREELMTLGLRFFDAQHYFYFGTLPCTELRRALIALIARQDAFTGAFRKDLTQVALRCYGASPLFWNELRQTAPSLPSELAAAAKSFGSLMAAVGSPQSDPALRKALGDLADRGVADAGRLALDLLSPSGMAGKNPSSKGLSGEVSLRFLAAPLAPPLSDLADEALAEAMQQAYHHTPAAPLADVAGQAGALARRLIESATDHPEASHAQAVRALLSILARLFVAEANHRGVGLGLALLADLAETDAKHTIQAARQTIAALLRETIDRDGPGCLGAPWPYAAAKRLAVRQEALFRELCTTVPELSDLKPDDGAAPVSAKGLARPSALDDTLVIIDTQLEHLDDVRDALDGEWLRALEARGVPTLFAVGREDGAEEGVVREGNILSLPFAASPQDQSARWTALIEWVRSATDFTHVTLLDDETRLAVTPWMDQKNYRLVDFYGRVTTVWEKDRDRRAHQSEATSTAARQGFEKLPRDLTIADGRFGLTLSRRAMEALHAALATPEGQLLQCSAFHADRLISAALQQQGIWPDGSGLYASHFACDRLDGPLIAKTPNGFVLAEPGDTAGNITQVTHGNAAPRPPDARLWPRKIWAHHAPVRLGLYSNALHLISPEHRLSDRPDISVISVLRNELFILPHFLEHYRSLGVERFLIADNGSTDGSVEYLHEQPDVILFSAENQFRHANQGTDWKIALMQHYCRDGWALIADADEFLVYPDRHTQTLATYLSRYDGSDVDAVRCLMLDMYPKGALSDAKFTTGSPFDEAGYADRDAFLYNSLGRGPFSNAPTLTSGLRHRIMPGSRPELFVSQKVPLFRYRPWMRFSISLHYAADVTLAPADLAFAHFKYHADFREKAEREVSRGQYFNNAEEYRKYLNLAAEGQDRLYDPDLSVPWRDVPEVSKILRPET